MLPPWGKVAMPFTRFIQARKLYIIELLLPHFPVSRTESITRLWQGCLLNMIHVGPFLLFPLMYLVHAIRLSDWNFSNRFQWVLLPAVVFANQIRSPHCSQSVLFIEQIRSCHIMGGLYYWSPNVLRIISSWITRLFMISNMWTSPKSNVHISQHSPSKSKQCSKPF